MRKMIKPNSVRNFGVLQGLVTAGAVLALVSGGVALAQTAPAAASAEAAVPKLKRAQIEAYLATPDKVVFIDVRRPDEISELGSVPAFLNIQISELDRFLAYIPRDRAVVTISNHAGRAGKAAELLVKQGFNVVGAIGIEDFVAEGGAVSGQKVLAPAIDGVVAAGTRIEVVREGFEGTEGPVALADGTILFTENRADRIVKIAPNGLVSTFLEKTGGANALALNAKGELIAAETAPAGIAQISPVKKVLAAGIGGKPFNRPNDLALAQSGDIYFSDPGVNPPAPVAGAAPVAPPAVPAKTAFYWQDRKGKVHLVADDVRRPNGVAISADEKTVYLANTSGEYLIAFDRLADGSLAGRRDFARLAGFKATPTGPSSGADGIVVDKDGRVFVATNAGVEVFSPAGQALGVIKLPKQPQNLAFGGQDGSRLYAVGRGSVYRIATLTKGVARPGK